MILNSQLIKKYGISSNGLKILALTFMIIDHIGAVLLPQYRILRYIGRLSFPLYCFLITEGFFHTKNVYKYGLRLLIFAFISEIPFDLAVHKEILEFESQNVFFTLFIGLVVIYIDQRFYNTSIGFITCFLGMGAALLFKTDYSIYGVLTIYCFYIFKSKPVSMAFSIAFINIIMGIGGTGSQKYAALAMIPILLYSGKKRYGSKEKKERMLIKYLFYIIYPLHLLILYWIYINNGGA